MKPTIIQQSNHSNRKLTSIFTFTVLLCSLTIFSQNTISGKVADEKGKPVSGANVFIEGTYDGASSSETGDFSFTTTTTGNQTLVVSFLIYETSKQSLMSLLSKIKLSNYEKVLRRSMQL